uniref:Si:ch211-152c8.2 n=2 Tax=Dicentrarchus labrax TaxID=13489 RepID=A0A8P4GMM1_DICLA
MSTSGYLALISGCFAGPLHSWHSEGPPPSVPPALPLVVLCLGLSDWPARSVNHQRPVGEDEAKVHISLSALKETCFSRKQRARECHRTMSAGGQRPMFFLGLPDLKKLLCVSLTLQQDDDELRSKQIKTCRELVLLYSDILASPALDSFTEITVVTAIPFFHKGILQVFGQRRGLQLGSPQCVLPGILQCCLSYSLITRLAPSWNKAGLYLITGRDFLTERGRLNAVSMELSTSEGQLCISIDASTVRLPPTTLEDFDLPPLVLRRFCSDPDSVLDPTSTGRAIWCYVLPSMKRGQIITISRQLPRDGPFKTYRDLQNHWNRLYGYRLPELAEEEVVYCSVYFRLVGERLFTYPLSCIRLQPLQRCPRDDLQGALGSFLSDLRDRLQSVCGLPARLTGKPRYSTVGVSTAATVQVLTVEQINVTSSSSSIRAVLTQLPPPPPPPPLPPLPPRPVKSPFGSQPPAWPPLSQQDGAQRLLGNGYRSSLTQSQEFSSSSSLLLLFLTCFFFLF